MLILAQAHEASAFATKQTAQQLLAQISPQAIAETARLSDLWPTVGKLLSALAA